MSFPTDVFGEGSWGEGFWGGGGESPITWGPTAGAPLLHGFGNETGQSFSHIIPGELWRAARERPQRNNSALIAATLGIPLYDTGPIGD